MCKPKFTIKQFRKLFPDDAACLDKIFQVRYGRMEGCPDCGCVGKFRRITTRRCYQCRHCYYQLHPCAGTVFHKSSTSLVFWFYTMYLMTTTRNGLAAKEVQRQLGVTYKCAWRMCKQVRTLMSTAIGEKALKGFVELDESYFGGKPRPEGLHFNRWEKKQGRAKKLKPKTVVFGMIERKGDARAEVVEGARKHIVWPIIEKGVDKSAKVSTDENMIYRNLYQLGYDHKAVYHAALMWRNEWACTNTMEGFWSQIKRTVKGTHIFVSPKYLQLYVNECTFRYNHRTIPHRMFTRLLVCLGREKSRASTRFQNLPSGVDWLHRK